MKNDETARLAQEKEAADAALQGAKDQLDSKQQQLKAAETANTNLLRESANAKQEA